MQVSIEKWEYAINYWDPIIEVSLYRTVLHWQSDEIRTWDGRTIERVRLYWST